jgi:hypothetical protein
MIFADLLDVDGGHFAGAMSLHLPVPIGEHLGDDRETPDLPDQGLEGEDGLDDAGVARELDLESRGVGAVARTMADLARWELTRWSDWTDPEEPLRVTTRVFFRSVKWARRYSSISSLSSSDRITTTGFFSLAFASTSSRSISTTRGPQPRMSVCPDSRTWL